VARRRRRWNHYRDRIDPRRLVFIDETWIKTNMAPLRGWGTRGERVITHVPHGHWQTMTFIGALRHDRIEAPWVLDGPINAEAFKTYVRAELLKTLKPDDIVVLDDLNSHKGKAVRAVVKAIGARLFFLPSYSPDLNPIEQAFAKIKHAMRKRRGRRKRRRQNPRHHDTTGMRELPGKCRIQVNLNATRSNCRKDRLRSYRRPAS
jgi:transposase